MSLSALECVASVCGFGALSAAILWSSAWAGTEKPLTLAELLAHPDQYHTKAVTVRGVVTQPELHLDEEKRFIDFVFVLKDPKDRNGGSITVFGRHDRTQGDVQIESGRLVEVEGIFYEHRAGDEGLLLRNVLQAGKITRDPDLRPHRVQARLAEVAVQPFLRSCV